MKSPFWAINAFLALLLCALGAFLVWSSPRKIRVKSLEPASAASLIHDTDLTMPVSKELILENDIFGTYTMPLPKDDITLTIPPIPQPPRPVTPRHKPPTQRTYLDPLPITLNGIIATTDETYNRAIIQDNATQQEGSYSIGDTIKDGQIIRIFPRKVVLIRSNGQQEVLFVNTADTDEDYEQKTSDWNTVVQPQGFSKYALDPFAFVEQVPSLAHFIEVFDLMTVFKQGENIGCRIGQNASHNALARCGLQTGDLITHINNTSVSSTQDRLAVYNEIITQTLGDAIVISLTRTDKPHIITYTLVRLDKKLEDQQKSARKITKKQTASPIVTVPQTYQKQQEIKQDLIKQKYTFAPTVSEIKKQEQKNMMRTSRSSQRRRSLTLTPKTS